MSNPSSRILIRTYQFLLNSLSSSRSFSAFAKDATAVMTSGIPTRVQAFIKTSRKRFDTFSRCSLSLVSISTRICVDKVPISSGFPHAKSAEAYRSCKHEGGRQGKEPVIWWLTVTRYQALGPKEAGIWVRTAAKSGRMDVIV